MVLAGHQPAAGTPDRDVLRELAVDLRVQWVAQTQLEPGAEQVPDSGAVVGPASRARHEVHAVGQATLGQVLQLELEFLELGAQRAPAVHDEEDVAVAVVEVPGGAARAVGLDRVDPVGAEVALPGGDDPLDLGHDPPYDVGLAAGRDTGQVGRSSTPAKVPPPKSST